ncbi:unnamed protein product [Polarella glacialis]|uniref:Uncharacterized protein n=1 Tax=Polarella glacialis TaxID=89957 RepID=A0A813JTX6_POLGL|nr:unnamed protein product [Polarella glacialis]
MLGLHPTPRGTARMRRCMYLAAQPPAEVLGACRSSSSSSSSSSCLRPSPWASRTSPLGPGGAWDPHPAWDLGHSQLAARACVAAEQGIRDPFLWQAIRLRSRTLASLLSVREVAALLGSTVRVGLIDAAFLSAMGRRLETLLRWGKGSRSNSSVTDLTVCCNALLRAGLDTKSPLFEEILRVIARGFSKPSVFEAALLATCLVRLRRSDSVLLAGSEAAVVRGAICAAPVSSQLQQCSMLLSALAVLQPKRRPAALTKLLEEQLPRFEPSRCASPEVLQRSMLAVIQAEVRWSQSLEGARWSEPSALVRLAAEKLAGLPFSGRWAAGPGSLRAVAEACRRWGQDCDGLAALAPRLLRELRARLTSGTGARRGSGNPTGSLGFSSGLLLQCLGAALPLCQGPSSGRRAAEPVLEHLLARVPELTSGQLIALTELVGLVGTPEGGNDSRAADAGVPLKRAQVLRSELYRRVRDLPLKTLPRALASLLQILPGGADSEVVSVLRRCTGRIAYELREMLQAGVGFEERQQLFNGDALGEVLYVCAACNYQDEAFLDACQSWILADRRCLSSLRRDVSLVHLLHSLAVLQAVHGELLHVLVSATQQRLEFFDVFQVLGFLDAAALLQAQADKSPMASAFDDGVQPPPSSGVGEQALSAAVGRAAVLLPSFDDSDLYASVHMLRSMRLPKGCAAEVIFAEAARRGID